jgi:predicted anti-sigma-YlaC factor YlaD
MHAACDRAREWASADADGELSSFERVLLGAHMADCSSCREYHTAVSSIARALRTAPIEQLERPIEIGRIRRRLRLRLAPAAAAMAVAAVGLGSMLASSDLRSGSVGTSGQSQGVSSALAAVDTMDLRTAQARARVAAKSVARASRAQRPLSGPVLHRP